MGRLCERPGCSEPASVAYGMRAEDLVFWLDTLRADSYQSSGVLCQRHAESMVVPRHWTLDDLRDPVPRLFRPTTTTSAPPPAARRRKSGTASATEQLLLTAPTGESERQRSAELPESTELPAPGEAVQEVEVGDLAEFGAVAPVSDETVATHQSSDDQHAAPWTPTFDESDDLDGLLSARSPLLARAFRGDDRPKPA